MNILQKWLGKHFGCENCGSLTGIEQDEGAFDLGTWGHLEKDGKQFRSHDNWDSFQEGAKSGCATCLFYARKCKHCGFIN